jgi:SAM-dependent methyltransferase
MDHVTWHDVECGGYWADLPLWRELAAEHGGAVLDLGAGAGRVALDLAAAGHVVHALDVDPLLLAALRERAGNLPVHTHVADARDFDLGRRFGVVLAPMQTVQLLGGPDGRRALMRAVHRHLEPGGTFAAAIAAEVEPYDDLLWAPMPDVREIGGVVFSSRPVAIRAVAGAHVLERLRERVGVDGTRDVSVDRTTLDSLDPDTFEAEGRAEGYSVAARREVAATDDHVGSAVVVLRG